jgi:uncharacterized protein with von Willebrand factor type A (vWA) domain
VVHVAWFGRALGAAGARVSVSDELDGVLALTLVDLLDQDEVRRALEISLKIRPSDREAFAKLFRRFWVERLGPARRGGSRVEPPPAEGPPSARAAAPGSVGEPGGSELPEGTIPGYSPEALLRRKPFDECTAADLDAMERLLARLSLKLATRRSRRLAPTRGRGMGDLRRSFRHAVGTGAELAWLARRARVVERPSLVVLCDTSGSMDPHARFLLGFMLSLGRVAGRIELFAFNTALTRLTPRLARGNLGVALARLATDVPDWSGGTRLGECLSEFVARYDHLVDPNTTVVIVSDGLDRGEPEILASAMRDIRRRARRVIWLNPLLGDPRYRPLARGMEAALPFVDHFAPAHNLESLERFITLLEVA